MSQASRVDIFEIHWVDEGLHCYKDIKARDAKQAIHKWHKEHERVPLRAIRHISRLTRTDR